MLQAGFARLDVTPPLGTHMSGYPTERKADGILDPLLVTAVVFSDEKKTVAMLTLDQIGIPQAISAQARKVIAQRSGLDYHAILLCCTHIHTGPCVGSTEFSDDPVYNEYLFNRCGDAVTLALADMQPATLRIARNTVKNVSFVRRFLMKDGSTATNPGYHNPNIDHPIGEPDETVQLVRVARENAKDILLVNFQVHPDVVSGSKYSADFPGFCRRALEGACDDVLVAYFNGAQGDTNHVDVHKPDWMTGGGYAHSQYMGRAIAGAVLAVMDRTEPLDGDTVDFATATTDAPLNVPAPEDIPWAEHVLQLFAEGRQKELANVPMGSAIAFYQAQRILDLKDSPATRTLEMTALKIGGMAITGAPGEPFTDIGRQTKASSPFPMTFYCCCCNGYDGYLPMEDAFAEGGYEASTATFQKGIAERIIACGLEALQKLDK